MDAPAASFDRTAMLAAALAGLAGFVYSVAFVILRSSGLAAGMLTGGGLLSVVALVALYRLVRPSAPDLATVGLIFGVLGAAGAAIHGAYDLANVLNPPASIPPDLPSAADPRGFLTFGVSGLGVGTLSAVALRAPRLPRSWAWLGLLLGVLLVVVYLGRLLILDAASPLIVAPAGLTGFIVNPAWYLWLATILRRTG